MGELRSPGGFDRGRPLPISPLPTFALSLAAGRWRINGLGRRRPSEPWNTLAVEEISYPRALMADKLGPGEILRAASSYVARQLAPDVTSSTIGFARMSVSRGRIRFPLRPGGTRSWQTGRQSATQHVESGSHGYAASIVQARLW